MGNICEEMCSCCQNNQKRTLVKVSQPLLQEPAKLQKPVSVVKEPPVKYVLEQPTDTFEIVTGEQYGDGPHPSTAKLSYMPKLTKEQIQVLQRQLPLKQQPGLKGSMLSCFFLTNKRIWYEGEWIKGLPNGKGKAYFETGTYFEGYFKDGFANCNDGILVFPEGSYYRGQVKDSKLNGKGVYYNAYNRNWYRGDFANDKPEGFGSEEFSNGNRYEGQFRDGYKNGRGKFTWRNGMTYDGDFKMGYMWGQGMLQRGKSSYKGQFERGKKIGQSVRFNTETGTYEGPLSDGLMNGNGQFSWYDNKKYMGGFKNGQLHGVGSITYPNGQKVSGKWDEGMNMEIDKISGI